MTSGVAEGREGARRDQACWTDDPHAVFRAELEELQKRRHRHRLTVAQKGCCKPSTSYGLVGLALSGGGIRSAALCLGAVQALASKEIGAIERVDYVSSVSGGGYIGAAMVAGMAEGEGEFPFPSELGKAENKNLRKLRDFPTSCSSAVLEIRCFLLEM